MKLHKFFLGTFALASMAAAMTGCTDDLNIDRKGVQDMNTFYQTDQQALEAITYCYTKLNDLRALDLLLPLSDDIYAGGGTRGDQQGAEQLNEYRYGTENGTIKSAYQNFYGAIYAANLVLNNVADDSPLKKQYRAEALFFRAYGYFLLADLWGDVPLILDCFEDGNYARSKSPASEIWNHVEQDLKDAISSGYLTQKSSVNAGEESIRVTLQTAQALLAKVYLYEKKYSESRSLLQEIIKSGKYDLAQCSVGDLFQAAQNYNCEAMLFVNQTNDANLHAFDFAAIGPNIRNDCFDGLTPMWMAGLSDLFWIGFGYYNPRLSLYNAAVAYGEKEGTRLSSSIKTTDEVCEATFTTRAAGQYSPGNDGVWNWKGHLGRSSYVEGSFAGFYNNFIVMRYADVLLMMAENEIMLNGAGAGDEYINKVRVRSGLSPKSGMDLEDLKNERRFEFALESQRYMDLKRWGDCAKYLSEQGKVIPILRFDNNGNETIDTETVRNTTYGWQPKHEFLPIPQAELEYNQGMEQNPDWL